MKINLSGMLTKWLPLLFIAVLCFSFTNPVAELANTNKLFPPRWEHLGTKKVKFTVDHDVIVVTRKEGKFNAIQLRVKGAPINMHRCVVHFGDGSKQEVLLRENILAGGKTRIIDLKGGRRVIKKVSLWYDTKNAARKRATVNLWGRHI